MAILLDLRWSVSEGDEANAAIDYYHDSEGRPEFGWLDETEQLVGTPVVTEVGSSDLTITDAKVSTSDRKILGYTCPAGKAVQFSFSGMQAGTTYTLRISTETSDNRTVVRDQIVETSQ